MGLITRALEQVLLNNKATNSSSPIEEIWEITYSTSIHSIYDVQPIQDP